VTSSAIAKWPSAWAHTIEERTAALVVLVGQERSDQLDCVQAQGIWIGLTLPWVRRKYKYFCLKLMRFGR
jgi:hypothetical protein